MINFNSYKPNPRVYSPVTVTDPNITGEDGKQLPIQLQLRKTLQAEEDQASMRADEYNAKYITGGYRDALGNWVKEPQIYMPFQDLATANGEGTVPEAPPLGYGLLIRCANIEAMQPESNRYSMDQLLVMSVVAPIGFSSLVQKANEIASGVQTQGNASAGS